VKEEFMMKLVGKQIQKILLNTYFKFFTITSTFQNING